MKKRHFLVSLISLAFIFAMGCGGSKEVAQACGDFEVIEDPFQDMTDMSMTIIDGGGVAAVGQGTSARQDLAKKKAETDARAGLAQMFNTKVQNMSKQFQEEIGSADDSEINEAFTSVTKTLTSQLLQGAVTKKAKYLRNKENGQYTAGVVVAIEPNKVNMSILDELQKKDKKLYERFRASQAYDELKKEMEEYEEKQENY